jgi:hypothetical protein
MCGTPFPHRSMTVPTAQSTLSFTSTPLEITAPAQPGMVTHEPLKTHPAEQVASTVSEAEPGQDLSEPTRPEVVESPEAEPPVATLLQEETPPEVVVPQPVPSPSAAAASASPELEAETFPEPRVEFETDRFPKAPVLVRSEEVPATVSESDSAALSPAHATEVTGEQMIEELERLPVPVEVQPAELTEALEPAQIPIRTESEPEEAGVPPQPPEPRPVPVWTRPPSPPMVIPQGPSAAATLTASRPKPAPVHRSPDSLQITSPPASAGMPTFQEVADAAGAPPLSPFEQLAQTPASEDEELKQFVANFRYSPPVETADELTMRSEVPVMDKEAPAEFHHPSFDGDEPPPAAEPHPTGQEYYPPPGEAPRPRFLEIDQAAAHTKKKSPRPESLLGLEQEVAPPSQENEASGGRRWWLWSSIAVLIAIFGALGFLEGRAQSTNAFRGPIEWARLEYAIWRDKLMEEFARSKPSEATQDSATQPAPESKPETSPGQENAQPAGTGAQPASSAQPDTTEQTNDTNTAAQENPAQSQNSVPVNTEPAASAANNPPAPETAKPVEPPPAVRSSKPQPGQQELNKALDASDATAAAAWLWKATSRGNSEAPVRLADMYIKGNGVPRSCEQALVLLRSAAIKENAPARNRLAALYANGTCVGRDKVRAYQLMSSALQADPHSEWARENREQLWNQMTPSERAMAQKDH